MSDPNTVVDQPAQSESTPEPFAWLNEPTETTETSAQTPEPTEEAVVEESSTEPETVEAAEPSTEEQPEDSSMDDFLAALVPEERARYAKRYPNAWKLANDPDQPEDVRQLLRDKINTDFEYKRLKEQPAAEEEPTPEAEEQPEVAATDPAQRQEQYYKAIENYVEQKFDKQAVERIGMNLYKIAFGVDTASDDPGVQELLKNAPAAGKFLSSILVDGLQTTLPDLLPAVIEHLYPGTAANVERQTIANAWESVRASDPAYAKLPAHGSPDGPFGQAMRKAAAEIPGFDQMRFPGTPAEQAVAKYKILAKVAVGKAVTPVEVANAIKKGKTLARTEAQNVRNGQALGAGKSNSTIDNGKGDSSFRSMIEEFNASQRSTPLK